MSHGDTTQAFVQTTTEHSFGLMRIGAALLALPVETLREVIASPKELGTLPIAAQGLCGTVQLRGTVIPVLDLRPTLGLPVVEERERVIVMMRYQGRLLGLLASSVQGMAKVRSDRLHVLNTATPIQSAAIATHSFELDEGVATLLDAARIAALPDVPMVEEPKANAEERTLGLREPLLLFRCGALPFGIDAMSVDGTVPSTVVRESSLKGEWCRGVITHHGYEVPVIDTLKTLGLGEVAQGVRESAAVVLRFPKGYLALMLDEVRDIVRVPASDILPMPICGVPNAALFKGMLAGNEGEQHLLLNAASLHEHPVLSSLASLSQPVGGASSAKGDDDAACTNLPYLTYRVGVETASSLIQVSEIVAYPTTAVPLKQGRDAAIGVFTHRKASVPLVCLCTLLGRPVRVDTETARVLLVEDAGQYVGFVVQSLCSIENAKWEQANVPSTKNHHTVDAVRSWQPLIEVGVREQRRTLPRLDLVQLARALRNEMAQPCTTSAVNAPSGVNEDAPLSYSAS